MFGAPPARTMHPLRPPTAHEPEGTMTVRSKPLVIALAAGALTAPAAPAEPLVVRNQHPITMLYGLPVPLPARLPKAGSGRAGLALHWANFAVTEARDRVEFTLDGEVVESRIDATYGLTDRLALRGEVAFRSLGAGTLDATIERFHDALGLPNGSRDKLPEDQLLLAYSVEGVTAFGLDRDASGLADLPLAFGYQLRASDSGALAGWLSVKLPTGSVDDLTGSGAVDVALSLAATRQLGERGQAFAQVNLAWLGEGDLLPTLQEDHAWSVLGGASWHAWRGLDLTAQLEGNSGVLDSGLDDFDGGALVLSFGGTWHTSQGWRFEFGLSEDIQADASPDVVFDLAARRDF
jgi:hypothetical protein